MCMLAGAVTLLLTGLAVSLFRLEFVADECLPIQQAMTDCSDMILMVSAYV